MAGDGRKALAGSDADALPSCRALAGPLSLESMNRAAAMTSNMTSISERAAQASLSRTVVIAAAVLAGIAIVAALALWSHYGTAVFVETIAAGVKACL
jgi:hypothetical protein